MKIIKEQYKFLKAFDKKAKKYKKNNKEDNSENEVLNLDDFTMIINKYKRLDPSSPLFFKSDVEEYYDDEKKNLIGIFFEKIGFEDMVEEIFPNLYGITPEGRKAMEEYKAKITTRVISILSVIVNIITAILNLVLRQ